MRRCPQLLVAAAALTLGACLPEGRPVEGRLLVRGRNIEKPSFVGIKTIPGADAVPYVIYEVRTSPPIGIRAATYNLLIVNYDTGEQGILLENVADRDQWPPLADSNEVRYYVINETAIEGGGAPGVLTPVGTLVRLDLRRGILEEIPNVSSYSVLGTDFWYRTVTAGERLTELHYRFGDGTERVLGLSAGAVQKAGEGRIYFVAGEDKTLSRITTPRGDVQPIRNKVTRFLLNEGESWLVLQTADPGKPQTLVRSIDTGDERAIPGTNTCCWQSFSGTQFIYSESAAPPVRGKLHIYDVVTEEDQKIVLPEGLSDLSGVVGRPRTQEALYTDSHGRVALVRSGDEANGRLLDLNPVFLNYTEDGRYLLYIDPVTQQPLEGRLMIQDAEFAGPPRQVNEPGSLVPDRGYFFVPEGERRILVFWSHIGRNASDLFFSNHETGDVRTVATGISEVTVTARRVVGVVRVSGQDLVGDLVNKDVQNDQEIVLAHRVSDATVWGHRVAFVIRERAISPNDGLWATGIDGSGGMHIKP